VHPFRAAAEAGDIDAAIGLLADDVVFHSPVVFKPYEGREAVGVLLRAIFTVSEGTVRYVREVASGDDTVLEFVMEVGGREVNGVDMLTVDADGRIADFTVMIRPMSALLAVAEAMRAQLEAAS
jgi:ketosteroid isomerase-like protein